MRTGEGIRSPLPLPGGFSRDTRGGTAAIFAIALPVLVGMAALAVDVGVWTVQKRQAQGAADQAAYSAAVSDIVAGNTGTRPEADARAIAAGMGFVHGQGGVTVDVTELDTLNGNTGTYWEVIVRQPQGLGLAALFGVSAPTATARAVAGGAPAPGGNDCLIATAGINFGNSNNANFRDGNCNVYSNSTVTCGAGMSSTAIKGNVYVASNSTACANKIAAPAQLFPNQPAKPDPFFGVTATYPSAHSFPASCSGNNNLTNGNNPETLNSGTYCNVTLGGNASATKTLSPGTPGITINGTLTINNTASAKVLQSGIYNIKTLTISNGNGAVTLPSDSTYKIQSLTVGAPTTLPYCSSACYIGSLTVNNTLTLAPGPGGTPSTYYIGSLTVNNGGTINATGGTTLVLMPGTATPMQLNNGATLNITAPSTGAYEDIAILALENNTSRIHRIGGNNISVNFNVKGGIYLPYHELATGNMVRIFSNTGDCIRFIVRTANFGNGFDWNPSCPAPGTGGTTGGTTVQLLE